MLRVVVVGASADVAATLQVVLGMRWGLPEIAYCGDADSALESVKSTDPHLVLFCAADGMASVFDFVVAAKTVSRAAVVLLSDDFDYLDRVKAFESGADDCIAASCVPIELLARINAILRRTMRTVDAPAVCGRVRIHRSSHMATVDSRVVALSPHEYRVLQVLSERPDMPVSHAALLTAVWGPEYATDTDLLRKTIFRLRSKLEQNSSDECPLIVNARGMGYSLRGD